MCVLPYLVQWIFRLSDSREYNMLLYNKEKKTQNISIIMLPHHRYISV